MTTTSAPRLSGHTCRAAGIASASYDVRGRCLVIGTTIVALLAAIILLIAL